MGIRTTCPNGHKLNVKAFLAGLRGICPHCGASFTIPTESNRSTSKADAVGSSGPQVQAAERGTVGPSDGPSQPHPVSRQAASSGPVKRPPPLPAGSADAADQPAAGREAVAAATTTSQFAVRQSLGPVAGSPSAPAVVSTVRQPSAKAPTEAATPSRPAEASTSPLSGFVATASATVAEPEPPATLPPELQAPDP